jgi:hypothetical protein
MLSNTNKLQEIQAIATVPVRLASALERIWVLFFPRTIRLIQFAEQKFCLLVVSRSRTGPHIFLHSFELSRGHIPRPGQVYQAHGRRQ